MERQQKTAGEKILEKKPKVQHQIGNITIEEFVKNGLSHIMKATRTINSYPSGASRDLYCAYPSFGKIIDAQSYRIMGIISNVLKYQNIKGNIQRRQQDEQFEMMLECNDAMLERINSNLDELAGIKKNPKAVVVESCSSTLTNSAESSQTQVNPNNKTPIARLLTARNIARPQIKFSIPVDNSATKPFVPGIKEKPNALKPLELIPEYDAEGNISSYLHPYDYELMNFVPHESQLVRKTPRPSALDKDTPCVYVDTVEKLQSVIKELKAFHEIAVDVEHHSYRTFLGITCLVQISTRQKDYIIDALKLREHLHALNEILTDPKILKVFHGADLDIEWLQRDLSVYVVNLFDTYQAAKALNFPRLSLAYLLKYYCDIEADKTFQLADWRIRPLPEELIKYARQDTHHLIYIYERLNNDLLDHAGNRTNILHSIYQRSMEVCRKRYIKPKITSETHMDFYQRSKKIFDNQQLYAFREIFKWRDSVARTEDESYGYVLPNHMMLQIAESLPREMQGILACCNPIPPLVRQNLHALHQIVIKAREQTLIKPICEVENVYRSNISTEKDYNSKLHCPHDLSQNTDFRDDLPTLLKSSDNQDQINGTDVTLLKPTLSVFDSTEDQVIENNTHMQFISPYARYLAMLPLAEKEKNEELARIEAESRKKVLCPEAEIKPLQVQPNLKTESDGLYSIPFKESLKRKCNPTPSIPIVPKKKAKVELQQNSQRKPPGTAIENTNTNQTATVQENKPKPLIMNDNRPSSSKKRDFPNKKGKWNKFNANKMQQKPNPSHSFDYKNVDYSKFQGGSQKSKGSDSMSGFRGKQPRNKANKKFNKLFTFSNVNKKK